MATPMGVLIPVFFMLTLSVTTFCYSDQWLHQIYVDSQTGVNDSSCWEDGYSTPCLSLNLALKGAQHYNHSTAILLQPGQHHLHSGRETQLWNVSQLAIVGNGSEGEVAIRCRPLAGLGFFWSASIEVRNVSVIGCGAVQNSTSRNVAVRTLEFLPIKVALHFRSCKTVSLVHVNINESNGTSVVLYNTGGVARIDSCYFSSNSWSVRQDAMYRGGGGGGGIVLEFANSTHTTTPSNLTITNSIIMNNKASSGQFTSLSPAFNPSGYFGLGRGGGLSVVFREGTANNTVQFSGVRFESNTAQFGGGIFLAFYDDASNNRVSIEDSEVTGNEASLLTDNIMLSGGGGVYTAFIATDNNWPFNNTVTISNSIFTSNGAGYGGGIAVDVQVDQHTRYFTTSNKLLIANCSFYNNDAFQGSSAYSSQDNFGYQPLVDTVVCCSNFTKGHCSSTLRSTLCSGNFILNSITLFLRGNVIFMSNQQSALELHSSSVELPPGTQLHFINNTGLKGAALHLVDCSHIIVNSGTAMTFQNNMATSLGGAIYATGCDVPHTRGRHCFVTHTNSSLHPNSWETNFTFINNRASYKPNSIFVDSIRPCVWSESESLVTRSHNVFCWRGWSYENSSRDGDCPQRLQSGPDYINTPGDIIIYPGQTVNLNVTVFDGCGRDITNETSLHLTIADDGPAFIAKTIETSCSNNAITRVKSITLSPSLVQNVKFLADCYSEYYEQSSLLSVGLPQSMITGNITVYFNSCQNAFSWRNANGLDCASFNGCVLYEYNDLIFCCDMYRTTDYMYCPLTSQFCISPGVCLTVDPVNGSLTAGFCPYSYPNEYYSIPVKALLYGYNLSNLTCAPHREGRLCGNCTEGYGVAINSPDFSCVECEISSGAIFLFFEILPVLLMMIILAVLDIKITDGRLNGFVLYSQLLTLRFPGLGYSSWIHPRPYSRWHWYNFTFSYTVVYSIWNLNFLILYLESFCIPHADTAASAIALQYVIAVFPLLFIALTYIWIQLYSCGNRAVVCITRPVHKVLARFWQKFKIQPSLIDTYAGLILLSYMRFVDISVKLLQYTIVTPVTGNNTENLTAFYYDANLDYFGWPHAAYGVLAIVCLLVFVVPPVSVLLFYHLMFFQRCLSLCKLDRPGLHALVDAYQGCFRNIATDGVERRYFAGIYLLFRLYIMLMIFFSSFQNFLPLAVVEFSLSLLMAGTLSLLRPYKKTAHNVIDFLLFLFMASFSIGYFMPDGFGQSVFYFALYISLPLPVFFLICYLTYQFFKWLCCTVGGSSCRRHQPVEEEVEPDEQQPLLPPTTSEVDLTDYTLDDLFADRVLNPSGYERQQN